MAVVIALLRLKCSSGRGIYLQAVKFHAKRSITAEDLIHRAVETEYFRLPFLYLRGDGHLGAMRSLFSLPCEPVFTGVSILEL